MSNFVSSMRHELEAFHSDEEGMNTVESIVLVGMGVLIMIGLMTWLNPNVTEKVGTVINNLLGVNFSFS